MDIENLIISKKSITWERSKKRFNSEIKYKNKILNHGDHISISSEMLVEGEYKRYDLIHIPLELIDKIKEVESYEKELKLNEL